MTLVIRSVVRALAVLAVVCAGLTPARAQGMYYKEIVKDGRIYVFNNAEEAERFEKSGELGKAITRPGAGPNGETVVADSERALELFFFKHGISEPVPQPPQPPPPPPAWRISGLVFGDYYYFGDHHIDTTTTTPTGTAPKWKDQQGFWFRRLYFTYDHDLSPKITTRFRLEANSNGKLQGGNLNPYVKDAYVRWTYHGKHMAYLGIWGSATFYWLENFWGLRHIEKTPADLYRFDSSRDFGVSFEGPIGTAPLTYMAQFGNGSGNGSETDPDKTVRIEIRYDANPGFAVEGFYGRFWRPANKDEDIYQAFGGWRNKVGRAGLQYLRKNISSGTSATDTGINTTSAFGVFDFVPKKASVFGRFDWLDGNNQLEADTGVPGVDGIDYLPIDNRFDFTFGVAGVELYVHPNFRISPNVEFVRYGDGPSGVSINNDLVYRMTFYWNW